jgi:hypothetical protein
MRICALLLTLALAAPAAMAVEQPAYTVLRQYPAFEIRRYEPQVVAEVNVPGDAEEAGNAGFRILAGYIFGRNKGARKIEMTAPVTQTPQKIAMTAPVAMAESAPGEHVVRFTMPREWRRDSLPEPEDRRISLREEPGRTWAVIRYSGLWSQKRYREHLAKLREAMAAEAVTGRGEPVWARYDPPWTPWFMRRNEVWIETDPAAR